MRSARGSARPSGLEAQTNRSVRSGTKADHRRWDMSSTCAHHSATRRPRSSSPTPLRRNRSAWPRSQPETSPSSGVGMLDPSRQRHQAMHSPAPPPRPCRSAAPPRLSVLGLWGSPHHTPRPGGLPHLARCPDAWPGRGGRPRREAGSSWTASLMPSASCAACPPQRTRADAPCTTSNRRSHHAEGYAPPGRARAPAHDAPRMASPLARWAGRTACMKIRRNPRRDGEDTLGLSRAFC